MKKKLILLLLCGAMLLSGCQTGGTPETTAPPETTVPETTSPDTQPPETQPPETQPPEPSEPVLTDILWTVPEPLNLTYEEFFENIREYGFPINTDYEVHYNVSWGGVYGDDYYLWTNEENGALYIDLGDENLRIGTEYYPDVVWTTADEQWIYGIQAGRELFRMDFFGENRQTLYIDETGKMSDHLGKVSIAEGCALFFAAGAGEGYGIYRLYLPDMTLDLMATSELEPWLYRAYSNHQVMWKVHNPEIDALYEQCMNDPDFEYRDFPDAGTVYELIANEYDVPLSYYYYCNTANGDLLRLPEYSNSESQGEGEGFVWWETYSPIERLN